MAINKVLVVDDSAPELSNLKKIIADMGCIVISASNGIQAVELAKKEKPDIIFMDIIMPEMDGYEATRKLSNDPEARNIPIVFVSSNPFWYTDDIEKNKNLKGWSQELFQGFLVLDNLLLKVLLSDRLDSVFHGGEFARR